MCLAVLSSLLNLIRGGTSFTDSEESRVGEAAVVIDLLEEVDIIAAKGDKPGIEHPPQLPGNINSFLWDPNLVC